MSGATVAITLRSRAATACGSQSRSCRRRSAWYRSVGIIPARVAAKNPFRSSSPPTGRTPPLLPDPRVSSTCSCPSATTSESERSARRHDDPVPTGAERAGRGRERVPVGRVVGHDDEDDHAATLSDSSTTSL